MPGKFDSKTTEKLYTETPDEQIGDVSELGWYGLYRKVNGYAGCIIREDNQGFVDSVMYSDIAELAEIWLGVLNAYDEFDLAMEYAELG